MRAQCTGSGNMHTAIMNRDQMRKEMEATAGNSVIRNKSKGISFILLGVFLLQWSRPSQNNIPAHNTVPLVSQLLRTDAIYKWHCLN